MDDETRTSPEIEASPAGAASGARAAWLPWILVAWAFVVLFPFLSHSVPLIGGVLGTLRTVGFALLSCLSFWLLGARVLRRLSDPAKGPLANLDDFDRSLVEIGLGIAIVMLTMFALGALGLYSTGAAFAVLLVPFLATPGTYRSILRAVRTRVRRRSDSNGWSFCWLLVLAVGVMSLLQSLTPAKSQDALVYHLAVPARYVATGGIEFIPSNFFASFPQNVDMLFTLGLLLEGDVLAKWYHWMLSALATLGVVAVARTAIGAVARTAIGAVRGRDEEQREGQRPGRVPGLSGLAAVLFATIPTAALISTWAYVDLGVVFFTMLSTLLFVKFWNAQHGKKLTGLRHSSTLFLVLAGVFAGIVAGIKYTGGAQIVFLVAGTLVVGFSEKRSWSLSFKQAFVVGGIASLVVAPWLVKNAVLTGNPLHPFAYSIFGGRDWDVSRAYILSYSLKEWGGVQSVGDMLRLPWDVTVNGEFFSQRYFDGVIGGAFLIGLPLLIVGLRASREFRLLFCFAALYVLVWVGTTHQIRFLLPALGFGAALLAASVALLEVDWHRKLASRMFQFSAAINVLIISVHFASHNPLPVVLGLESRHAYLARELAGGDYPVFHFIDEKLPEDSRILFGSCGNPGFLCKRDYHADAFFENRTLTRYLGESKTSDRFHERLRSEGFTHILFRAENVFDPEGRKSEIPPESQALLGDYLMKHARSLISVQGTFLFELLYEPVARPEGASPPAEVR